MRDARAVRRLSTGLLACGLLVALPSAASGLAPVPSLDTAPVAVAIEPLDDALAEVGATVTVPADAVFSFTFGQASASAPEQVVGETWVHPLPSGRLLSQYGHRGIIPGVTTSAFHNGIDLAAPAGTPIQAAGAGTVVYAAHGNRVLGLSGWVVVVEHTDGTSTAYNHMEADGVLVEVGDEVEAGDVVGLVGSSGRSTGPHLHFSAWVEGHAVNPVNYLQERGVKVPGGRATEDETVFGDPFPWDWSTAPVGEGETVEEPIGSPEPDPVPQQPAEPTEPADPVTPVEPPTTPTRPPAKDPAPEEPAGPEPAPGEETPEEPPADPEPGEDVCPAPAPPVDPEPGPEPDPTPEVTDPEPEGAPAPTCETVPEPEPEREPEPEPEPSAEETEPPTEPVEP